MGSECLVCYEISPGKWNPECSRCPASTYDTSPGGSFLNQGCQQCPEGKYSTGLGNVACLDCDPDSDSDSPKLFNPECSKCPTNTYDTQPGSSFLLFGEGCTDCPQGKYSVGPGASDCLVCYEISPGKWNPECSR